MRPAGAIVATLCAIGVAVATPALAGFGQSGRNRPILVELDGHLGAPRPSPDGETRMGLSYRGHVYPFALKELRVLESGPLASDVIDAIRPYKSTYLLTGSHDVLAPLATLPADGWLVIRGYVRLDSRYLNVSSLKPRDAH